MRSSFHRAIAAGFIAVLAVQFGLPAAHAQSSDKFNALNDQSVQLYKQGKYPEAVTAAQQALAFAEKSWGHEHPNTLTAVNNLAFLFKAQGRYGEAEPLYRRVIEARERTPGPHDRDTLTSVSNLATLYRLQGRYGEAEPLFRRVLATRERVLGRDHPDTLKSVNNLAVLYLAQGRYVEAEPLYLRVIQAYDRGPGRDQPDALTAVENLGSLYQLRGLYAEAEPLFRRVAETRERTLGRDHPDTLISVGNVAAAYLDQGRYAEAEPLYRRVLETRERVLGADHPATLGSLGSLGTLYYTQGRYDEAEPAFRRAFEASERVLGRDHPNTMAGFGNLASLYANQGRYAEAEPLFRRALETRERVLGRDHPDTLASVSSLAVLYQERGHYAEAEPLFRRTLEARERVLGRDHPDTLASVNNLGGLHEKQGRYSEAEPLFRRALETRERVLGRDHPETLLSVSALALLFYDQDRYDDAEKLYTRAIEGRERVLGADHPDTLASLNNLAALYFRQGDWPKAARTWRRSTGAIAARTQRGVLPAGQTARGKRQSEVEQAEWQFRVLVKAIYRLAPEGRGPDQAMLRETFQIAQWAHSSDTAQSLAQMAARGAAGNPVLGPLVREHQDSLAAWQKLDVWRSGALGLEAAKRDAKAEAENARRLAALDKRIGEIDRRLTAEFPDYFNLASAQPLAVEAVQAQLKSDEALVLFLDTRDWMPAPEETFVWVVTAKEARWVRSGLGTAGLTREVQALRCGLDLSAWGPNSPCPALTRQQKPGSPLPFDHARAHGLYKALFGQAEDLVKGKHLLLVPSGALTQLPFSVLVTAPPASADDRTAAWLARDHAVTVLPAVSSLKALRATGHPSKASKPMIGFANPLLEGDGKNSPGAILARDRQSCAKVPLHRVAALEPRGAMLPVRTRGGLADVAFLRDLPPLPETADEICMVATDAGANPGDMRLGARASEHDIKQMSAAGLLAQYRILHFATHGAMAGELNAASEPGLILTPPRTPSEDDDGYLSASEIAGLKLDADWVILSACLPGDLSFGRAAKTEFLNDRAGAD